MIDPYIVDRVFSIGIVLFQIDIAVILLLLLWKKESKTVSFIRKYALWLVLFVSLASIVGSLTYSEILGYAPCKLCWLQRIFIYPQAIIAIIALITKDVKALKYTLALSIVGILISSNHYLLQMTGTSLIPCDTLGQGSGCSGTYVKEFGYMTIPLMCWTLYAYSILVSSIALFSKKDSNEKLTS